MRASRVDLDLRYTRRATCLQRNGEIGPKTTSMAASSMWLYRITRRHPVGALRRWRWRFQPTLEFVERGYEPEATRRLKPGDVRIGDEGWKRYANYTNDSFVRTEVEVVALGAFSERTNKAAPLLDGLVDLRLQIPR